MVSAFRSQCGFCVDQWGSTIWVCTTAALQGIPMTGICNSWRWSVVHTKSALSGSSLHCLEKGEPNATQLSPSHSMNMVGIQLLGLGKITRFLRLPYMAGRDLFKCLLALMTWWNWNLCWAFNLVILVWWLGARLMNLLTPGQWSVLFLNHTFALGSQVRCQH